VRSNRERLAAVASRKITHAFEAECAAKDEAWSSETNTLTAGVEDVQSAA
jgi:hypothetical protein